jgi:PAS domain S-box-containing protein
VTDQHNEIDDTEEPQAGGVHLRWLIEHSLTGILLTSPSGRIFSANPAACRMLGRSEDEICRGGRAAVVDPADTGLAALLEERNRKGHASGELTFIRGDGTRFTVHVHSAVFHDAAGRQFTSLSFQDLTGLMQIEEERAKTLRALRESEERFRLMIEYAPIGMALLAPDGRFVRVNQRLCEIVGYSSEELERLRFQDITHPDDVGQDVAALAALLRGEIRRYSRSKRYIRKDHGVVDAVLHTSLLRSEEGEPQMFIAQIQDVTEEKRLEARLALADRMASVGTLASGIAHEINNPLTYVIGNLELIAESLKQVARVSPTEPLPEVSSLLDEARSGADRIREIVQGLKRLTWTESKKRTLVDLSAALDAAIKMAAHEISHRARLVKEYAESIRVEADESRLVQVFLNLLVNAAHAIPEGDLDRNEIRVKTHWDDSGHAIVEFRDTGGGIPAHLLGRIFDPFYTTKEVGIGSGLGLSISHAIVTSLGGTIDVSSKVGEGSVFRVILPRGTVEDEEGTVASSSAFPADGVRRKILVIDDDTAVGNALRRALANEHEITVAGGGREALDRIGAGERFDVIMCDVMMPEISGSEVYKRLLDIDPEQAKRVVFITGGAFTASAQRFLDSVPNPRLGKPFEMENLRTLLRVFPA